MKDVRVPPNIPLSTERVFQQETINVELVKNYLEEGGKISKECLHQILDRV